MTFLKKTYGLKILVANSIVTENDSPTSFVLVFSFVNYTTK
jgi:hypothetical protein